MIVNQLDSQLRKNSPTPPQQQTIDKESIIKYILFYCLQCIIDLLLLIYFQENLKYELPKLGIDLIFGLLILLFPKKVTHLHINIFLMITKVTTSLFIALVGNEFTLILNFLGESNQILNNRLYIAQQFATRIVCLIVISLNQSQMGMIILVFVMLFEVHRISLFLYSNKNEEKLIKLNTSSKDQQSLKEDNQFTRLQNMPCCLFIFSFDDFQLTFKNQFSIEYFSQFCSLHEELEEFILSQIQFQTVDGICTIKLVKKRSSSTQNLYFKTASKKQGKQDLDQKNFIFAFNHQSLREILNSNFKQQENSQLVLELHCQHIWDGGTSTEFVGSIRVSDDEIILILMDISNQQRYQDEMIKSQFKAQIVQSFSHELRTPLNSACNFLQCCLGDKNIPQISKQTLIQPAYNSLRLQSHLINDIIDFNSYYAEDIEMSFKEFYIKDLIDEVYSLFSSSLEMKELSLYVDLVENDQTSITSDFSRLTQIIVNILQNSIKYSSSGLILMKMTSFSSSYLKFTIKDEGLGIDEERLIQLHQMLTHIEMKQDFVKQKQWHGFGLLVSQVLLSHLSPPDYKSLLIRSGGVDKGTKVIFYIQNRNNTFSNSSSNNCQNTLRFNSKAKISLKSVLHQSSINGTLIQICDLGTSNKNQKPKFIQLHSYQKSLENSMFSDSCLEDDLNKKMCNINHLQPSLITDIAFKPIKHKFEIQDPNLDSYFRSGRDSSSKILSYRKIKFQDEQESEILLKSFIRRKKCTCQRILSIDDEIFNQKSIQYLLSRKGFDVILAFNGQEAITLVKEIEKCSQNCNIFLLILTDYQMPIMDGIETTKILCQMMENQDLPHIHIVGLTAFNSKRDIQNCIDAGMSDVLSKPLNMKEFYDILNAL